MKSQIEGMIAAIEVRIAEVQAGRERFHDANRAAISGMDGALAVYAGDVALAERLPEYIGRTGLAEYARRLVAEGRNPAEVLPPMLMRHKAYVAGMIADFDRKIARLGRIRRVHRKSLRALQQAQAFTPETAREYVGRIKNVYHKG